jgi:hypothetical protein
MFEGKIRGSEIKRKKQLERADSKQTVTISINTPKTLCLIEKNNIKCIGTLGYYIK